MACQSEAQMTHSWKPTRRGALLSGVAAGLIPLTGCATRSPNGAPDMESMALFNGKVTTLDPGNPMATAILIENGLVKDVAGLYRLDKDELLKLDRMGDKLATKIMTNIEVSKQRPLHRVLFALGIIHVGSEIAELLTQRYASLNEMAEATPEELTEIPGIGPKIAESVADYFAVALNQQVLKALGDAGVVLHHEIQDIQEAADDLPFSGKSFVVTGTLSGFTRREAEDRIKILGGNVASAVTRKTDYLVAGASPGSKVAAAGRLGTEILDEAAFLELIDQPLTEPVA